MQGIKNAALLERIFNLLEKITLDDFMTDSLNKEFMYIQL